MTINLKMPDIKELKPRITVFGVGGAGGNAVNNMISGGLLGCDFVVANADAQALTTSKAERIIQMGVAVTQGLGAGAQPEVGRAAAEEVIDEIRDHLTGAHMVFVTAGMGGGTGTGAAPVVAQCAKEAGILTVGVVTKPFDFEGKRRMRIADDGIAELQKHVDTLLIIPNQNLFRVANEKTTFADAFAMADQVLYSGVACITDLMVKEGLINLDFADVRAVMSEMGKAMMGTGEASGDKRALQAAEAAISNPLIDETSMKGAKGLLISITGGKDLLLYEVDEAATRIREEVDSDANIIVGATFDESLDGIIRVSVVATGIDVANSTRQPLPKTIAVQAPAQATARLAELSQTLRANPPQRPAAQAPAAAPAVAVAADRVEQAHRAVAQALAIAETAPPAVAVEAPHVSEAAVVEDVTIRPITPKPSIFLEAVEDQTPTLRPPAPPALEEPFIPPRPERAQVQRPVRMPPIEEFPPQAQKQLDAQRGKPQPEPASLETKRLSLLERLAKVSLVGKRSETPEAPPRSEPAREAPRAARPVQQPMPPMPKSPPMPPIARPDPVSEYGKRPAPRPAPQGLDQHGRPAPVNNAAEDDQLEIPAFLRRQAN